MYLLSINPNDFKGLTIPYDESFASHDCLRWAGRSKQSTWKPLKLIWQGDENEPTTESDEIADFTRFGGGPIALSERAYNVVKDLFKGQVEFLSTIGPGDDDNWRLLNVINLLDIMDVSRSQHEIYPDGTIGTVTHAFLNEPESGNNIFLAQKYPTRIFINEKTKETIESANLTGTLIREWLNP